MGISGYRIAATLSSGQGDGIAASLFDDDVYSMTLTIERVGDDLLVSGLLTSANGYNQFLSATDTTASTLGTYTFDRLGFLLGGNLDTDQAQFSNLDVSLVPVPEPSTWAMMLMGFGGVAMMIRRRK